MMVCRHTRRGGVKELVCVERERDETMKERERERVAGEVAGVEDDRETEGDTEEE